MAELDSANLVSRYPTIARASLALTLHIRQMYNRLAKFSVCLAKLPFSAALKSFHKTRIYGIARDPRDSLT